VVVDYKTDRETISADPEGLLRYERQVALYAAAISRATGAPAAGVLVQL
jgi:ATP-dependent exoDNAse (exonuclease V) beta subunit